MGILLCNFYDSSLHLDESTYIEFEKMINEYGREFRKYMNDLIIDCKKNHDVFDIVTNYKLKQISIGLKNKINPLDILGKITKS